MVITHNARYHHARLNRAWREQHSYQFALDLLPPTVPNSIRSSVAGSSPAAVAFTIPTSPISKRSSARLNLSSPPGPLATMSSADHAQLLHMPMRQSDRLPNTVVQKHAIWQTSKKVMLGGMCHLQRYRIGRANITEGNDSTGRLAMPIMNRRNRVFNGSSNCVVPNKHAIRRQGSVRFSTAKYGLKESVRIPAPWRCRGGFSTPSSCVRFLSNRTIYVKVEVSAMSEPDCT